MSKSIRSISIRNSLCNGGYTALSTLLQLERVQSALSRSAWHYTNSGTGCVVVTSEFPPYVLRFYDPGGTTGWARFVVARSAFSRPENYVMANVLDWDCGELEGTELEQQAKASAQIYNDRHGVIASEDFELTQQVGGNNLLSPVRMNAVFAYLCASYGNTLQLQKRSMRTSVTATRLTTLGFSSPMNRSGKWTTSGRGKDAFAAMQHSLVWLRRVKQESKSRPWRLENGEWDCRCTAGRRCDIRHLR